MRKDDQKQFYIRVVVYQPPKKTAITSIEGNYRSFYEACKGPFSDFCLNEAEGIFFSQKDTSESINLKTLTIQQIVRIRLPGIFHGVDKDSGELCGLSDTQVTFLLEKLDNEAHSIS